MEEGEGMREGEGREGEKGELVISSESFSILLSQGTMYIWGHTLSSCYPSGILDHFCLVIYVKIAKNKPNHLGFSEWFYSLFQKGKSRLELRQVAVLGLEVTV